MQIKIDDLSPKKIINIHLPVNILDGTSCFLVLAQQTYNNAFCNALAQINGFEHCLITPQVLSVKYNDFKEDVMALVLAEVDDLITANEKINLPQESPDMCYVEAVADAFIRPSLNRDNGDINIISVQNNDMQIEFTGHCAGCPYAQNTLQNVIIRTFTRYLPKIRNIYLKE